MSSMERWLATLPGVKAAVRARAETYGAKAAADFAKHNRPGGHEIRVKHGRVDSYVFLEGPHAVALEFGHVKSGWAAHKGIGPNGWVKGINVISKVAR